MHGNNSGGSTRITATGVEEDDEHRQDDEEAQSPEEIVQEDIDLGASAVVRSLLCWIVIDRDPRPPVVKLRCGVDRCGTFCWTQSVVCISFNFVEEVDQGINDLVAIWNEHEGRGCGCCCCRCCCGFVLAVAKTCAAEARSHKIQ